MILFFYFGLKFYFIYFLVLGFWGEKRKSLKVRKERENHWLGGWVIFL